MPPRFGIIMIPTLPVEELAARWSLIEELGYDSLWLPDHFVNPRGPTDLWFETWTLLTLLASRTSRIRIGTLVANMTLRNPALLAIQAMTVDHISRGRLVLGIGAGRPPADHQMTGVEMWPIGERLKRFKEFATIIDRLLRQGRTTWNGTYYKITDASLFPPPVQKPRLPLLIGGKSPTVIRVAAGIADVWNTNGGRDLSPHEAFEATRAKVAMLQDQCQKKARDPGAVTLSFLVGQTQDTPLASRDAFQDFIGRYEQLGFREFILFWLRDPNPDYALYDWIRNRAVLEKVATDWIPSVRPGSSDTSA